MIGNYENISENRKLTNTSKFILPLITEEDNNAWLTNNNVKIDNGNLYSHPFINAFFSDLNIEFQNEPLKSIYLLYKFDNINEIPAFKGVRGLNYISEYRRFYNNREYTVYVYQVPLKYTFDLEMITSGRYSELSQPTKERILRFWNNDKNISDILNAIPAHQNADSPLGLKDSLELIKFNITDESLPEEQVIPIQIYYEKVAA
jgi:hypothetical protein